MPVEFNEAPSKLYEIILLFIEKLLAERRTEGKKDRRTEIEERKKKHRHTHGTKRMAIITHRFFEKTPNIY